VIADAWEMEGITFSTASTFEWAASVLGRISAGSTEADWEDTIASVSAVPPGANGIVALPMLNGAGAPDWNPLVSGAVAGIRLRHDRFDVLRALVEGIGFELRRIRDSMPEEVGQITAVRVWGGPARSRLWVQLIADILGIPAFPEPSPNTGLMGAAIVAGLAMGWYPDAQMAANTVLPAVEPCLPTESLREVYDDSYGRFCALYSALERFT
jgi:xylulokinase